MTRTTIFLSHATPEDNDYTRWLAGKLTLAGYDVWYDLDRLKGGDYSWNKIESAIRNDSVRMIAIVSNASHLKDGVRNEWDLGITLEKQLPGFVIPVRIDNFDFSQMPITLHRKYMIDFHRGWHAGLIQLLDTLADAAVPRRDVVDPAAAKAWLPSLPSDAINWVDRSETLESNWLPILSLPPALETTQILSSERQIKVTDANRRLPWFEFGEQIAGFAPRADLVALFKDTVPLRALSAVDTESFVTGSISWGAQPVSGYDASYRVEFLIRQAWDLAMEAAGLKPYELSNHRLIWYVPSGLVEKDKVEFMEASGKRRKKQLAGTSSKLKVNWNYAVGMHAVLSDPRRIELRAHIVFTGADGQPIESVSRMHQLRRSFCRNWWNDRWRGFLRAFLALISKGYDVIMLPVGADRAIQIGALPLTFLAPRALSDGVDLAEDEEILLDDSVIGDEQFDDESLVDDEEEAI